MGLGVIWRKPNCPSKSQKYFQKQKGHIMNRCIELIQALKQNIVFEYWFHRKLSKYGFIKSIVLTIKTITKYLIKIWIPEFLKIPKK